MKNPRFTQKEQVLLHLKDNGSINCMQAIEQYGILYLTRYIYLLRNKEKCNIKDEWICYSDKDGVKKKYKRYYIGGAK
jgi:hypothetical protein